MSAGAPASSPDSRSPRAVAAASHLVAMPSPPPPAPPAAAEHEKRPWPWVKKMKLGFAYAVARVFGGCMNRSCGMAVVGVHIGVCIIYMLSFTTDPEVAHSRLPMFRALLYLILAVNVLLNCQWICYNMPVYGVYARMDNPPKQQLAAAEAVLLPPPPPEMDMC